MRAKKTISQRLVFTQQAKQQVFGLNIRRPELAGLIPRKEDHAPGFLRVAFEHITFPPDSCGALYPPPSLLPASIMHFYRLMAQAIIALELPYALTLDYSD